MRMRLVSILRSSSFSSASVSTSRSNASRAISLTLGSIERFWVERIITWSSSDRVSSLEGTEETLSSLFPTLNGWSHWCSSDVPL